MPIYEGIALIQEKQAVVLDLGSEYTKFGFTGEVAPRCIVRSEFWCARTRRHKRLYDYANEQELYENLVNMLHMLYFRHVLVSPKERRVVVVESLLTPTAFRETLARVLFTHFEVAGAVWADGARLAAWCAGAPLALVVSLGAREAEVCAVVHGVPVTRSLQAQPLAAAAVHAELARLLHLDNDRELRLPHHVLEDIKVKCCFVAGRERAERWARGDDPEPAPAVRYPLPGGGTILVSGRTRERAVEPLFTRDNDMSSLGDIVLQCLLQAPVDARRGLAESILVTGGTAALPGVKARLAQELRALVTLPPYADRVHLRQFRFRTAPAHDNYVAWLGGALVGAGEALAARALPRDQFARQRRLRDWVNLLDNTPSDHPHRRDVDINPL